MQFRLSYPLSLASVRFDSFFVGGWYHIPDSKKTIQGKRKVRSADVQTFVLSPRDERFWFAGIPKAYIKGQLRASGTQTDLTASFRYPYSVYVFYGVLLLFLFLQYYSLLVLAVLAMFPTVQILSYNSVMKEELLKTLTLIFEDQTETDETEKRDEHDQT